MTFMATLKFHQQKNVTILKGSRLTMPESMILPTYPGKIHQTSLNPYEEMNLFSETVGEGLGISSRCMWVRSQNVGRKQGS